MPTKEYEIKGTLSQDQVSVLKWCLMVGRDSISHPENSLMTSEDKLLVLAHVEDIMGKLLPTHESSEAF